MGHGSSMANSRELSHICVWRVSKLWNQEQQTQRPRQPSQTSAPGELPQPVSAASGGMHKVRLRRSKLPLLRRQDSHMELLFYFGTLSTGSRMWQTATSLTAGQQQPSVHEPVGGGGGHWSCLDQLYAVLCKHLSPIPIPLEMIRAFRWKDNAQGWNKQPGKRIAAGLRPACIETETHPASYKTKPNPIQIPQ